jgi:transcriptional regulator with XRE-family HTH domain
MPSGSMGPSGVMAGSMSEAIRVHMERQHLSGFRVAARGGVSQNYMAKRLRDEAPFTVDDVAAIAAAWVFPWRNSLQRRRSWPQSLRRPHGPNSQYPAGIMQE